MSDSKTQPFCAMGAAASISTGGMKMKAIKKEMKKIATAEVSMSPVLPFHNETEDFDQSETKILHELRFSFAEPRRAAPPELIPRKSDVTYRSRGFRHVDVLHGSHPAQILDEIQEGEVLEVEEGDLV